MPGVRAAAAESAPASGASSNQNKMIEVCSSWLAGCYAILSPITRKDQKLKKEY
jgi:hypothetical protein